MPQLADFIRYTVLVARDLPNNTNNGGTDIIIIGGGDNNESSNNGKLEAGVIVAIAVAGVAVAVTIVTCVLKRRKRQQKRAAKRNEAEMSWPGWGIDERAAMKNGNELIGIALGGEERSGRVKKVSFAVEETDTAPPPSYEVVVNTKNVSATDPK